MVYLPADRRRLSAQGAIALALVTLVACGGGDDTPASPVAPPSPGPASITVSSGPAAVSSAYGVSSALYSASSSSTAAIKSAGDPSVAVRLNLAKLATDRLFALAYSSTGPTATKAVRTVSEDCPGGGSISATVNDADDSSSVSTGDSGSVLFVNCTIDGIAVNGGFAMTGIVITGSAGTPSQSVGATFTFSNLVAVSGSDRATVNGDMSVQAAARNVAPITLDMTVTGNRLVVSDGPETATLTAYNARVLVDTTAGTYTYAASGSLSGTNVPGTLSFTTPTSMAGAIGSYPRVGMVQVVASDLTSARLVANSPTSVTVQVDANADGVYESSQGFTWAQLAAL